MARGWGATPAAAEDYVRDAGPRLLRFARSLTLDDADAEDLLQDSLVKVIVHWRKVSAADDVDRYVRRVVVNGFLSSRRVAAARTVTSDEAVAARLDPTPSPEAAVTARVLADDLLATLDPRQRAVLVLRYLDDLPVAVVADVMGTTEGNVRVLAHRALAALRPLVEAEGVERH